MPETPLKITKLDAATRQLRTAITLWFADGDPVSIHALTFAAHEVIHTLFRRKGLRGLLFDADVIKDEFRAEFAKILKSHATFFKHAQRDPDGEVEFHPKMNDYLLLFTVNGLKRMDIPQGPEEASYSMWFYLNNPQYFLDYPATKFLPVEILEEIKRVPKGEFFEIFSGYIRKLAEAGFTSGPA
jgi:hypothetical protein